MKEEIFSKVEPGKLLHIIYRPDESTGEESREDIIAEEHYLQCSALRFNKGRTFRPHKHVWKEIPGKTIAQESWVVTAGRVKCFFYDVDDSLLGEWELESGDMSVTLCGGHTYEILEDNTTVYEYKSGPYLGIDKDKIFI